ncbi:hypothetical protein BC826DRAFT_26037 [Russula brevipes]|nr:hypothetical protein BC826DRAFT_26037 [Russula brevipes]
MMDRHLIYPPGWPARKRQSDWDADPSLKGKPIPILGTNVRLDTPEEVAAWIAERKRRWPTAPRVAEKKRKLEEAMANGGLQPDYIALTGNKRFRQPPLFDPEVTRARRGRGGGAFTGRGRGRGGGGRNRGHGSADASRGRPPSARAQQQIQSLSTPAADMGPQQSVPGPPPAKNIVTHPGSDRDSGSDDGDDDGTPEEVSSKRRPPGIEAYGSSSDAEPEQPQPQAVSDHPQPRPTIPPSSSIDPTAAGPQSTLAKAQPINHHRPRVPPPSPKGRHRISSLRGHHFFVIFYCLRFA